MLNSRVVLLALLCTCCAAMARAADLVVTTRAEFVSALDSAVAGDSILLAPGSYNGGISKTGLTGVTIRSQDIANPAVIDALGSGEVFKLSSARDVTIQNITFQNFSTNGINIDDGGNYPSGASRNITLRDITVRNTTVASGNRDAIKISGVDGFHIDRVQVTNWSTGGSAIDPVGSHNGIIENSRLINDNSGATASGVRPKGGSAGIEIRGNYVRMASGRAIQAGGNTDPSVFRFLPGESNYEADNITTTGNIIVGGDSAVSWAGIDGGIVQHNAIENPNTWLMRILNENQGNSIVDTQGGSFNNNLVTFGGGLNRVLNVGVETLPDTFAFDQNQWFDTSNANLSISDINLPGETNGTYGADPMIDTDAAVTFETDWGKWIVNPQLDPHTNVVENFERYSLATPGSGAQFDPLASNPFIGDWTFEPLSSESLVTNALSQSMLTVTAVPEPGSGVVLIVAVGGAWIRQRSRKTESNSALY